MTESALLLGSCLLLLVIQSLSLCVFEDETNSTCSSSSLLLVPRSQIKDNNGYSLIVDKLPNITTNCTSTNGEKNFFAVMGGVGLEIKKILDKGNTIVKITIPGNVGSGQHIISISYEITDPNCCQVEAVLDHEITVKVIDDPYANHQNTNPHTIQCKLHPDFSGMLTEFMLNDAVLGYCGHFTSPVEHKNGISIYYDTAERVCTLKIDKLTDDNKGNYSCSMMVPYPDGNRFLKLNSSHIPINCPKNYDKTILAAAISIVCVLIVTLVMTICCWKKPWKGKANDDRANNNNDGEANRLILAHNEGVQYGGVNENGANNDGANNNEDNNNNNEANNNNDDANNDEVNPIPIIG